MDLFQTQNLLSGLSRSHHQKSASRKPDRPKKTRQKISSYSSATSCS